MDDDDRTFDALGRLAGPLIDQSPIPRTPLVDLEQRARRRSGRRRAAAATAVVLVLVGVGGLMARAGTPDTSLETQTTPTTEVAARPQGDLVIFLNPDATPAQVQAVRDELVADPSVHRLLYQSQDDVYQDFRCLFADSPEMIDNVTPDILPTDFRIYLDGDPATTDHLASIALGPGVRGIDAIAKLDPPADDAYVWPWASDATGTTILATTGPPDFPGVASCPPVGEWVK